MRPPQSSAPFRRRTCQRRADFFWKWADVSLRPQGVVEPGAGEGPVAVGGAPGDPQRGGGLVQGQAGEEAQLDQLGTGRVPARQFLQGVPPLEALPSSYRLRRLLERRAEAAEDIEAEWGWLPADLRAALPAPDDLLAGA